MLNTSHEKALSTMFLTLIMLNIAFWGAIKPTIDTIIKTQRKITVYQQTLSKLKAKNDKLTQLGQRYDDLKPVFNKLSYFYPYNSDYSFLIDNLYRTTQAFGFKLASVTFSEKINERVTKDMEVEYNYLLPVTFSFSIVGNKQNLQQFLAYWESMPFSPQFISIAYNPDETSLDSTVSLVFIAYKFKYKFINE